MDLAVRLPFCSAFQRSSLWSEAETSCRGKFAATRHEKCCQSVWSEKTSQLSHAAALFCDASAGERLRYSHRAGVIRAQRCEHDDDLHARAQQAGTRCEKSARSRLIRSINTISSRCAPILNKQLTLRMLLVAADTGCHHKGESAAEDSGHYIN